MTNPSKEAEQERGEVMAARRIKVRENGCTESENILPNHNGDLITEKGVTSSPPDEPPKEAEIVQVPITDTEKKWGAREKTRGSEKPQ